MDSGRLVALLAVAITLVALGLAAPSMYDLDEGGGDGEPTGTDTAQGDGAGVNITQEEVLGSESNSWVLSLVRILMIPLLALVLYYSLRYEPHRFLLIALTFALVSLALVVLLDLIPLGSLPGIPDAPSGPLGEGGIGDGGGEGTATPGSGALTLLFLALAALTGLVVYRRYAPSDRSAVTADQPREQRDHEPQELAEAIGRAAGRAADQLEETSLENAIYEAWYEMTTALAVEDPATKTPAEFASAARAAGMATDDVDRLTRLFQDIRYGDTPVTEDRVRDAKATLRRIEANYRRPAGEMNASH